MTVQIWQVILLGLLGGFAIVENLGTSVLGNQALIIGTIAGLIMGDVKMGLAVGATVQLMGLGIQSYGGASVPDYATAAIVGTAFGTISGKGVAFGIGLAVPVGLLMIQADVLARFINVFFQRRIDKAVEKSNISGIAMWHRLGMLSWGLSRAIPLFIVLGFGNTVIKFITNSVPAWLTGGLQVAGGLLPAVGIAILLRFLPTKRFIPYLIVGFIAVAYLKMPLFGVAIVGFALALLEFKKLTENQNTQLAAATAAPAQVNASAVEGDLNDDEYED